jgi:hypothetical protein
MHRSSGSWVDPRHDRLLRAGPNVGHLRLGADGDLRKLVTRAWDLLNQMQAVDTGEPLRWS